MPNVHAPNGGMSHLLFLVAMRAISMYTLWGSSPSASLKEPPYNFKPNALSLPPGFVGTEILAYFPAEDSTQNVKDLLLSVVAARNMSLSKHMDPTHR